jgi:hypothetical protein
MPDEINDSQIKTINDNSQPAIQKYAAAAAEALSYSRDAYPPETQGQVSESESALFLNALENNNFAELDFRLRNYQEAYKKLKDLSVPSDLLSLHKEQTEIISSLIKIYQAIKEIDTDPLKANLALQAYQPLTEKFMGWLEKLANFIQSHP